MYEGRNVFGLTGGIGSGKSTVSAELSNLGAVVIDADKIVREIQEPGMPILPEMQKILGDDIIADDGSLIRSRAAERMFADDELRFAINRLVVPAVFEVMYQRVEDADDQDIVVMDVPLLIENKPEGLKGIVVVATPVETAVQRIIANRNATEEDARRRIASQVSYEERLAHADFVIHNDGELHDLYPQVHEAWRWMNVVAGSGKAAVHSIIED
jgi:dephospho-CoA kinase